MSDASNMIIEAHGSAATLYASGDLTTAVVLKALANVERLPSHVRALCVDLRAIRRTDSRAMRTLDAFLRRWRGARGGVSRVQLAERMSASLVAIKFSHRRWTPALATVEGSS